MAISGLTLTKIPNSNNVGNIDVSLSGKKINFWAEANSNYSTFSYWSYDITYNTQVPQHISDIVSEREFTVYLPSNADTSTIQGTATAYFNGTQKTVTFNPNGGTLIGNPKLTVTNFSTYQNVPSASKTNFSFNGWYITSTGGNYGPVENGTPVELATDITLYANWKSTITYKKGYGESPEEIIQTQVITNYGSISIINLDKTYRLGYTLTSWNT